ncbi:hypothetical protein [Apilactobacillus timberlakei]|uniref:hypothetical protein n=1 Tax=Apilactobacillus timberlakei TaxID=2008380 RepID=UPI0011298362|nr:hypothetical protein [Apilactobacillus timberlakei]TPR18104.1 hypothetical protein DYZ95_02045 [Apilactobacillus timberlakei]
MPSHINFSYFSEHQESNDDLKEYVNETITHDLFNNDYKNLKYELSMLVINLRDAKIIKNSHGYTTQAYQIYKIFNYGPTYYNCLIPTFFSIFDFIHYHIINTSKYIKKGIVNHYALRSALSNLKRENKSTKLFSVLYMINIYSVGERIYRSTGSSNYNKNQINRNTAVHGINNPDKYTINDFAKLVLLCKGSSEFLNNIY